MLSGGTVAFSTRCPCDERSEPASWELASPRISSFRLFEFPGTARYSQRLEGELQTGHQTTRASAKLEVTAP